jgi:hypothetical protein
VKLQLAAEDLQQNFHESSTMLVHKVSTTSGELIRTRAEVLGVAADVDTLASRVAADERSCSTATARLQQLDSVKERVLAAKSTLEV